MKIDDINNIRELRSFMIDEIKRLRNNEVTPASVNSSANMIGKILNSVKLEISYNKVAGSPPCIDFLNKDKELKKLENKSEE
jgi:hypothetical protein